MQRYWWTVWIKVAVLGAALLLAYLFVKNLVMDTIEPYLVDDPVQVEQTPDEEENPLEKLVGKFEKALDVKIDYEDFIFDFANQYAQDMMSKSEEEHNQISEPLS